jgi:uncharacterized protein (TIGR02284 family)
MDDDGVRGGGGRAGEALNWLLQAALDSADGFRQAADLARNPEFRALFLARAGEREALATAIGDEVRAAGGEPTTAGSVVGELHQAFTRLRNLVDRGSDKGLLAELVRNERAAADKFARAADDPRMPAEAREAAAGARPGLAAAADELAKLEAQFQ